MLGRPRGSDGEHRSMDAFLRVYLEAPRYEPDLITPIHTLRDAIAAQSSRAMSLYEASMNPTSFRRAA